MGRLHLDVPTGIMLIRTWDLLLSSFCANHNILPITTDMGQHLAADYIVTQEILERLFTLWSPVAFPFVCYAGILTGLAMLYYSVPVDVVAIDYRESKYVPSRYMFGGHWYYIFGLITSCCYGCLCIQPLYLSTLVGTQQNIQAL